MSEEIRLLVVDDEPDMRGSLRRLLRLKGYEVRTAGSGEQAIDEAREFKPDGILMDIRMPGINGIEAFRRIRVDYPDAFVCFMTAYSDLAEEAAQESFGNVLEKPVDVDTLCNVIAREASSRPVLIVDDDPDFCASLRRALETRGFQIQTAHKLEEAEEAFAKGPRAVVLLDMYLDDVSGLELLPALRELNPNVAVIGMSGLPSMQHMMKQELDEIAVACFPKPLNVPQLVEALKGVASAGHKRSSE